MAACVNLARLLDVPAEVALLKANRKFVQRFSYVENKVKAQGGDWKAFSADDLINMWKEAKQRE